jgi:hypothetical protein
MNIHASSRIRAYDPGIQASQGSSYLRPLGYRARLMGEVEDTNLCGGEKEHRFVRRCRDP